MQYFEQIKRIRKAKGLSQAEMAQKLETTQQQYSKYERGTQEMPVRQLIRICKALNASADEILGLAPGAHNEQE